MIRNKENARPMADLAHAFTLTPEEAARYLGRSRSYIYQLIAAGTLRASAERPRMIVRTDLEAAASAGFKAGRVSA